MSKSVLSSRNVSTVLLLIVTLILLTSSVTAAYAQTSREAQYDSPTASGEAAIQASELSGVEGSAGASSASAGVTGVLPSTGGPLVQLIAVAALALSSTGLLVLRQYRAR